MDLLIVKSVATKGRVSSFRHRDGLYYSKLFPLDQPGEASRIHLEHLLIIKIRFPLLILLCKAWVKLNFHFFKLCVECSQKEKKKWELTTNTRPARTSYTSITIKICMIFFSN